MAQTVSSLVVKVGADIRELRSAMKTASKSIQDAGKEMTSLGKTVSKRVTAPLVALGGLALKQAADFERLRVAMDNLNGSAEEGARNFERLKEFSAGTPFQLTDLAKAQNMLQGFGMEADNAFQSIKMIGDIAAISGGSIDGIGIAFGQAAAEGRLMTQDVRQLINQGVPAIKMLADTMGVAENQVLDLASQGKISFEVLQQAFRDATSEGGMFANGMAKQSQTLSGLFSTLKDNISIAMAEMGDAIAEAFNLREIIPALVEHIQTAIAWFASLSQDARKNMVMIGAAIVAIGPTIVALGVTVTALGTLIAALTSPVTLVVGAIGGLAAAITYVWDNWEAVKERISDIGWWRNAIISMAQIMIEYSPISLMIKAINSLVEFWRNTDWFRNGLKKLWNLAVEYNPFQLIIKAWNALKSAMGGELIEIGANIKKVGDEADLIKNPFEGLANSLEGAKVKTNEYKHEFGSFKDAVLNGAQALTGIDWGNMFTPVTQETELARRSVEGVRVSTTNAANSFSNFRKVAVPNIEVTTSKIIEMGEALQSQVTGAIQSFATTLGNAFTGDAGAKGFFNNILLIVADFGENLGKALIAAGVAAQAFQMLIANPVAAIAAGAALIATSKVVKNLLTQGPVTSVNDALITSNGDIIKFHPDDNILAMKDFSNLNTGGTQRVEVFGTLRGSDLFISSSRGEKEYGR